MRAGDCFYGNGHAFTLVFDHGDNDSLRDELCDVVTENRENDVQFIAVPDDGSYSPLERVSALITEITQEHIRSPLSFLQRCLWVTLLKLDAATVPLEHGPGSDDG